MDAEAIKPELSHTSPTSSRRLFLSRPLTRKGLDGTDGSKGPLGLTTVFEPRSGTTAITDLVFVHGLNGGSRSTWSKSNQPTHFWPREWLPQDDAFQDVRIHTFGYPSGLGRESILGVQDFARSLLAAVNDCPAMNQGDETSLIFVAHSMGGLVVKKAFILGHQEAEFRPLVKRISSIVFLATPHQGAAIAQTLARLMTLVPGARPFVQDLLPQSTLLQSIDEDFPALCGGIRLLSFYETRPMSLLGLIVERASAVMNLPNERQTYLDADHRHVAMFSSIHESAFVAVRNALATVISVQRSESQSRKEALALEDQAALSKFLGVFDMPEDDITKQDCLRFPGSCEWLYSNLKYRAWRDSIGSRLLWLRGRPGSGKSVLAGHIVNDLRATGQDSCFFFFQSDDSIRSTVNGCLRSMAWQMALLHPEVFARIKSVMTEMNGDPVDKVDANLVWRKIYSSGILNVRMGKPQFWVIDAMDECKESTDMMNLLARIQEQWPVSVLVTCRDPAESHLSHANARVEIQSYSMTEEDNRQDISLFLNSSLSRIPPLAFAHWQSPSEMVSHLVDNSRGSFLWASLVCSGLQQATSEREIRDVLENVPSDMDALYSNILDEMGRARFGKDLAKALLTWTTYAFRPLTTIEIQEPIEMDIDDRFENVEQAISRTCGNLLCVDSQGKIQLVHSTAREFLMSKKVRSDLVVSEFESHRRLALVCLQYLIQTERSSVKYRRRASRRGINAVSSSSIDISGQSKLGVSAAFEVPHHHHAPALGTSGLVRAFTSYASMFSFAHLVNVPAPDDEVFAVLSMFLGSSSVLRWVEFVATGGDLRTVFRAGKTIGLMLRRSARHSPPAELAPGQEQFSRLEKWGNDLTHLVTKFSYRLLRSPKSIFHLIPPLCPPDSAIRQQFADPCRGPSVHGLSSHGWDDCLTTITYANNLVPNTIATGPGFVAIGMMSSGGRVMVYDDSTFQEIHVLLHGEPVWSLAFSASGEFLAAAGAKSVRIWSSVEGAELMDFAIPSLCVALSFADEDGTLRVATKQNQLIEWDLEERDFFDDTPSTWTADLEETMKFRTPTMAAFSARKNLLCLIYRGENLVLWNHAENRIYDVYEKDTGSIFHYGIYKLAEGATTVRAVSLSHSLDANRLAATYSDGDLVVYNLDNGQQMAAVEGVNALALASSNDGRTLAGADSRGNLTLFEFDTLRPLYRIKFDTQLVPKCLAFTSDSLRFIEVRGNQCRVWAPTALLRTESPEDQNGDDISLSGDEPLEVNYPTLPGAKITSIATCKASSAVFCGMGDGSVHAYDLSGEPKSQLLFVQRHGVPINLLYLDEESSVLASSDQSGRVAVRKVMRRNVPRQTVWDTECKPLVHTKSTTPWMPKQILLSGKQSRLLVCTPRSDILWAIPNQGEEDWITQVERDDSDSPHWSDKDNPRWLSHPTKPDLIVRATASSIGLYRWSDLSAVRSIKISLEDTFDRLVSLHHRKYFATVSKVDAIMGKHKPSRIQIWDFDQLENDAEFVAPVKQLSCASSKTEFVVGTFRERMVVFTADSWIGSVDLAPSSEDSFVRHFFVPSDWVNYGQELIVGVGRGAEILFVRHSELAVIKRGLEMTDTGASFNPR